MHLKTDAVQAEDFTGRARLFREATEFPKILKLSFKCREPQPG